jgi:uncharacterized protein (TIGR03437 family)
MILAMKQPLCRRIATAVLFLVFPILATADLSKTVTLQTNSTLNLDTGATASSGGDLLWNASGITPQGKARAVNIGGGGPTLYNGYDESALKGLLVIASQAVIPTRALVANDFFVALTNGGNVAKVLVTAVSSASITLLFTTYGVASTPGAPNIKDILNNSSHTPRGFPNYGIAPSSLFVVTGNSLADPGAPVLQSSQPPGIPLTLNGASITVVVNGVTTHPPLYYTSPTQLAAVLPANTPVGNGTLTVTYKDVTSAPAPIQVVPSALGINTYDVNTGVATDAVTGALLTYANSGAPGQTIVLWTTGLGADPADSDTIFTSTPHSVNTPLQIYIGGVVAKILYQGGSGYPGVNQINVTIPQSIPTGCWVPLAAVTSNVISNVVTLPINNGGGACVDAQTGLNGGQIAPAGGSVTFKTGLVSLILTNTPAKDGSRTVTSSADAAFEKYTGLSYTPPNSVSPGGCILPTAVPIPGITGLDAGTITLTGPAGLSVTLASQFGIKGAFFAALPNGSIPSTGGIFTFKGSGGADVGPFTSTVTFANPLLTWSNPGAAAIIDKTQGLHVTWTGGNPGTLVSISGASTGSGVTAGYLCLAPVEAGQFTVPPYILLGLPAGSGGTLMQNIVYSPLTASGLDIAVAIGTNSYSVASTYAVNSK